jgi:SAM-dependent methyltransferase
VNLDIIGSAYRDHGLRGVTTLARYAATRLWTEFTDRDRHCPICGWHGRSFRPRAILADGVVRPRVACPHCHSLERHRMSWLYFSHVPLPAVFQTGADVVYLTPDAILLPLIAQHARSLRTSSHDDSTPADLHLDLEHIALPNNSVDAFVMNSVLASVQHLGAATSNMHRVLRPGGVIISCEYLHDTPTLEYPAAGYGEGWRQLGRHDLAQHLAPLAVEIIEVHQHISPADTARYGLNPNERILVLTKPAHPTGDPIV